MIVAVENLSHRYGARAALSGVTFHVARRQIFGLLGPNGSGKSTLFRILSTLLAPSSGCARIAGFAVDRDPAAVRRHIGVVFQSQSLDRKLTVQENLESQGHLYGMSGSAQKDRLESVLAAVGLADRRRDLVETLSGGLRRRVELAKAFLHQPKVLLMDEPSSGLDPAARRELWEHLRNLRDRHEVTVLLTTHILEEAEHCDRLVLLHQGRIVAEGTPAELKARIGGDVVVLEAAAPEELAQRIRDRFRLEPRVADGALRVEIPNGHRFITELVEAFPGTITSVALHKPTLEDVFVDETGTRIEGGS